MREDGAGEAEDSVSLSKAMDDELRHAITYLRRQSPDRLRVLDRIGGMVEIESNRLSVVDLILGWQGETPDGPQQETQGGNRNVRQIEDLGEAFYVDQIGVLLLRTDHCRGNNRRPVKKTQLDEPYVEGEQLVSVVEFLPGSVETFREHRDHLALLEQVDQIPPGTDHLSASVEEEIDEGKRTREVVDHGSHDPGLFHLLCKIQGDHEAVDGNAATVVGGQQGRSLQGDSLDPEALDTKPVLVHELEKSIGQHGGFPFQPEGIVSEFRGMDLDFHQAFLFLADQ